ncbi:hypothetical protein B0H16DRAFT_1888314 [Mycena metata]|uniref:F-box domain-containing protein n=1 Tax=Mycena metata TaxID=1033252 RepID=A0AAD7N7U3_9AGAR|nr:hypothetical protein B0H16DRAFT_1888314 [Mycena metata]
MHHCLKILEIVDLICDHLDPHVACKWPTLGQPPFRDLARFTRTCSTFQGPGLDHLWRRASLENLLTLCMPADLWAVDLMGESWTREKKLRLLRPIRTSDWNRVRLYAPRIQILWCGSAGSSLSNIFPALSVSLPERLLQNLQRLVWKPTGEDFQYIHLFLRHTLTEISFDLASDSAASLLASLAERCPKLTDISIGGYGYNSPFVSEFVRQLRCLKKVAVPTLNQDALEHLSQLPTLRSLHLHNVPTLSAVPVMQNFRILRSFGLSSPEIRPTVGLLQTWRAVPLIDFRVTFYDIVTAAEMHTLFNVAVTAFSHSSLGTFYIGDGSDADEHHPPMHVLPHHELRALQCFTNLTSLSIASPLGFDLDDTAVSALVPSWPRLVTLLLPVHFHAHAPRTTLACLHSFARHCPGLRHLTIALDATTVPTLDFRAGFARQRSLLDLDIEQSPLSIAHLSVARFLSAVFPRLREISTAREHYNNDEDDMEEHGDAIRLHFRWKEVEAMLPDVAAIRQEARMLGEGENE